MASAISGVSPFYTRLLGCRRYPWTFNGSMFVVLARSVLKTSMKLASRVQTEWSPQPVTAKQDRARCALLRYPEEQAKSGFRASSSRSSSQDFLAPLDGVHVLLAVPSAAEFARGRASAGEGIHRRRCDDAINVGEAHVIFVAHGLGVLAEVHRYAASYNE